MLCYSVGKYTWNQWSIKSLGQFCKPAALTSVLQLRKLPGRGRSDLSFPRQCGTEAASGDRYSKAVSSELGMTSCDPPSGGSEEMHEAHS